MIEFFLEKYPTGWSIPSLPSCNNTAPAATSLASTANLKGTLKSGADKTGVLCKIPYKPLNAFSHCTLQTTWTFFFNKLVKGSATCEEYFL